jgi:1,4-alpha-glucan branching enzyme
MTTTIVPVTFRFPCAAATSANHVAILGPFNGWNPKIHPLTKTPEGYWVIKLYLPPGRMVYCFDVDGALWLDPNDDGRIPNSWGSEYSIRYVGGDVHQG